MKFNYAELVWQAAVATVIEAGPVPDSIEDMPVHMASWCRLMRGHESRLRVLSDEKIRQALVAP